MIPFYRYILIGTAVASLIGCQKQTDPNDDVVRPMGAQATPVVHTIAEAESLTNVTGKFRIGPAVGANNQQSLLVPAGIAKHGKITGAASIQIDVAEPSKLNCWLRVKWTGTCSNSVIVKAPGIPPKIVGESATYNTWHWVKGPSFSAPKGPLKIELGAREDGVFIDQLMLTSDLERVPVGIESAPSLAIGDPHDANK